MKLVLSRFACLRGVGGGLVAEGVRESVPVDAPAAAFLARFAQVIEALYSEAADRGSADEHFTSVVKVYEDRVGTKVSRP